MPPKKYAILKVQCIPAIYNLTCANLLNQKLILDNTLSHTVFNVLMLKILHAETQTGNGRALRMVPSNKQELGNLQLKENAL